jgi:hypothetical protein
VLDRITDGNLLGMDEASAPALQWIIDMLVDKVVKYPGLWFVIDMIWFAVVVWVLRAGLRIASRRVSRTQRMVFTDTPRRINVAAFEQFLRTPLDDLTSGASAVARGCCSRRRKRVIETRKASVRGTMRVVKVLWSEPAVAPKCQTWKELLIRVRQNWEQYIAPPVRTQVTYDATNGLLIDVIVHVRLAASPEASLLVISD